MKQQLIILSAALFMGLSACKKDDNNSSPGGSTDNSCLADKISLQQTQIEDFPASHAVNITFDATNTASVAYDPGSGANKFIRLTIKVKTTDNATYETTNFMPVSKISAGATVSFNQPAEYGAGKTYQSYTITKSCD